MVESLDLTCFSESYTEAREKFVESARARSDTETTSLLVHVDAQGVEYTIDVAVVRGRRAGIVVVTSGVHGVEGYAGSAIQTQLLRQLKETPDNPTVVLIHAVNPFGMAHFRRCE